MERSNDGPRAPETLSRAQLEELFQQMARLMRSHQELPENPEGPLGETTRNFFINSWQNAREGLLARTERIRVEPVTPPSGNGPPVCFDFEVDLPFKRRDRGEETLELVPGPIRGSIQYRVDLFETLVEEEPYVVVTLEDRGLLHPNFSRSFGMLCLGELPPRSPLDLQALLLHVFGILSYQNRSSFDPADEEAARYFALDPDAMQGLEEVQPLY